LVLIGWAGFLPLAGCTAAPPDAVAAAPAADPAPAAAAPVPRHQDRHQEEIELFPTAPSGRLSPQAAALLPSRRHTRLGDKRPKQLAATDGPAILPSVPGGLPVIVRPARRFHTETVNPPAPPRLLEVADAQSRPAKSASASPPPAARTTDEIRAMLRDFSSAFNRHDAPALAGHWSDGAESVDLASGETTRGRDEVQRVFSALFNTDAETTLELDVESIRLVSDDVAVVDAVSRLDFSPEAGRNGARSRMSAVVARQGGRWMIESVRESPLPAEPADGQALESLDWLVGEWEDAGDGISAHTRCFWSTGRAFLIRCHTASFDSAGEAPTTATANRIPDLLPPGQAGSREITEIIGYDPHAGGIRSWVFTSEGRFAEGIWTRRGDRWLVRMEGRGSDEGCSCLATLERIGTDELASRCLGDSLADALPPACDFRRIER